MQTESVTQALDEVSLGEFDNLKPTWIESAFSGDNARGEFREFQSLDELGEVARIAGERFKACFAAK